MSRSLPNEQAKPRRLLSQIDEELVAEGVRGIQSGRWANPYQAAKVLAERAKGRGTQLSTIGRLHRKIGGLLALQDAIDVVCREAVLLDRTLPVGN